MRISVFSFIALLAMIAFAPAAFALTVDNETRLNTDGTAKFSDPDDQSPQSLLNTPLTAPGSNQSNNGQQNSGAHFSFSGGAAQQQQQQGDAFDHAYAHFGN